MKKSLKTLFAGICMAISTTALADYDIIGQVKSISPNSITIDSMGTTITVGVTPMTKVEAEYHTGPFDFDRWIPVTDIKVGEWVKIDAIPQGMPPNTQYIAEEIEVRR